MSKNLLKLFLFLWVFLLGTTPAWAYETYKSGTIGNCTWQLLTNPDNDHLMLYVYKGSSATDGYTDAYEDNITRPWNDNTGYHITKINKITVGPGVTNISDYLFNGCSNATSIVISSSVLATIGTSPFKGCEKVESITINGSTNGEYQNFKCADGVLYNKEMTKLIAYPAAKSGSVFEVPASVTEIAASAFDHATNLTAIVLGNTSSVVSLANTNAFSDCNSNLKIYVPNSKVSNYTSASNWSSISGKIKGYTFRLSNTVATLPMSQDVWPYTGSEIKPGDLEINKDAAVPLFGKDTNAQIGTLTHVFSTTAATKLTSGTNYTMAYTGGNRIDVGTYTAIATGTGDYSGTVTRTYYIRTAATATVTANSRTYDGTEQALVTVTNTGGTMSYRVGDTGDYSTTIPKKTNAGDYTVYWKLEPDENHGFVNDLANQKVTVTISKKAPEVSEFSFTAPGTAPIVYDGNAKAATVEPKSGISGMGTVTVKYYPGGSTDAPTAAGDYTVKISVAESAGDPANYMATTTELTDDSWTFSIVVAQDVDATDATYYTSLSTALSTAPTGHTVKLLANITESVTISTDGKSMTLDLSDKTLTAAASSSAITLTAGSLTIKGGTITGGNVTGDGGGINVTGGTLTLDGVNVTGNTASSNGGGVYFNGTALYLKGATKITGNTGGNLYLPSGKKVDISNGLASGASIGVTLGTTDGKGVFTAGNTDANFNPKTYFTSDKTSDYYEVLYELDDIYNVNQAQIGAYQGNAGNIHWAYDRGEAKKLTITRKDGATESIVSMINCQYNATSAASKDFTGTNPWLPFHSHIKELEIGAKVKTVGAGCCSKYDGTKWYIFDKLEKVTLSKDVKIIVDAAFRGCKNLKTIELPSSLSEIRRVAFQATGLESIVIPASVTKIEEIAFDSNSNLETVVMMGNRPSLLSRGFDNCPKMTIYVSNSRVSSYQTATNWKTYSSKIKGWTYRLSGDVAKLTLSSTSEMYTGDEINFTAASLDIKKSAAVPIYKTDADEQLLSLTKVFSTTANTQVASSHYTMSYTGDRINAGNYTATATMKNDYSGTVTQDFEIRAIPVEVTALDQTVTFGTAIATTTDKASLSVAGHTISAITLTETAAATSDTKKTIVPSGVTIMKDENDMTANFNITYVPGILTETVSVPVVANGWTTYWHPTVSLKKPDSGLTPYIVTNVTASNVTASEQTYIQKNTAYLLNYTGSETSLNLEVVYNQPEVTGMDSKFAKSEGISDASGHKYFVLRNGSFVWSQGSIPANKCYINLDGTPASTRGSIDIIIGNDGTTGIESTEFQYDVEDDGNVWYDMQGRRLDGKPSRKGLYIKNGKKVVVK